MADRRAAVSNDNGADRPAPGLAYGRWSLAAAAWLPLPASAGCSRPITVAVSLIGNSMVIDARGGVSGSVPEFLAEVGEYAGCRFAYLIVPRARAWLMAENGEVDLVPASVQTSERDRYADFYPTLRVRLSLVCRQGQTPPVRHMADLPASGVVLNVVRGYDYGPAYRGLLTASAARHQVEYVPDPDTIARKFSKGHAQCTLVPVVVLSDALMRAGLIERIEITPLPDAPLLTTGMYLSRRGLGEPDRQRLLASLDALSPPGKHLERLRRHFPAWAVAGVVALRDLAP